MEQTMSRQTLAGAIAIGLLIGVAQYGHADQTLKITFKKKAANSAIVASCVASMTPGDKKKNRGPKFGPFRNEPITWTLTTPSGSTACPGFDPTKVSLEFTSDLFSPRTLHATSSTITATTTSDSAKAPNGSRHRYTVMYDNVDAGDPEIDIIGDMGDTGPGSGSSGGGSSSGGSSSGSSSGKSSSGTKQSGAAKK
jgi:uncharacterized membrane protein YgcG